MLLYLPVGLTWVGGGNQERLVGWHLPMKRKNGKSCWGRLCKIDKGCYNEEVNYCCQLLTCGVESFFGRWWGMEDRRSCPQLPLPGHGENITMMTMGHPDCNTDSKVSEHGVYVICIKKHWSSLVFTSWLGPASAMSLADETQQVIRYIYQEMDKWTKPPPPLPKSSFSMSLEDQSDLFAIITCAKYDHTKHTNMNYK